MSYETTFELGPDCNGNFPLRKFLEQSEQAITNKETTPSTVGSILETFPEIPCDVQACRVSIDGCARYQRMWNASFTFVQIRQQAQETRV